MDGKNACRLTDKKFQNHENTVDLAGDLQMPRAVGVPPRALKAIAKCCNKAIDCKGRHTAKGCTARGTRKHKCCENAIKRRKAKGKWENVKPERFHPETKKQPACRLDVQIRGGPNGKGRVTNIWDFKFNCTVDPYMSDKQRRKYRKRFPQPVVIGIVGVRGLENKASRAKKEAHCEGAKSQGQC
jgi:hypothetical protein